VAQKIIAIAAIGRDRGLGQSGGLLYRLAADFVRMHTVTMGHPLIMGRKTWESIPDKRRPLPGRANIVVTRQTDFAPAGAIVVHSVEEAIASARALGTEKIYIFGGAEIYKAALPYTDELDLTIVDGTKPADAYFPEYESNFVEVKRENPVTEDGVTYSFVTFDRKK
jgi:dihydrofolate reductase